MTLKIFHTSDLHLGMKFSGYPEVQAKLSESRFDTLSRLIEAANKEGCDLFVISGDLFESVFVAKKNIIRAAKDISEFRGRLAVVLPGNHDFISPESDLWAQFKEQSGDNVLVIEKRQPYDLGHYDLNVTLYPVPCDAKYSERNYLAWIYDEKKGNDVINIGIAHGSLEGFSPDFEGKYYPMTISELQRCNLDLWLLGHTHIQYPSNPDSKSRIFYPGTPEPDGFDCEHEGRAWIIEIDNDKRVNPKAISTGRYRFLHDIAEVNSLDDLLRLKDKYSKERYRYTLMKLKLKGRLSRDEYQGLHEIRSFLSEQLFHLAQFDTTELKEEIGIDIINQEFTEGSFPQRLLTILSEMDDTDALQIAYDLIKEVRR